MNNMIDWDYWPYLWLVYHDGNLCMKDFNGWLVYTQQETIGM